MIRNLIYCRTSSDEQRERETIQMQVDLLTGFFHSSQLVCDKWFLDDSATGTVPLEERPEGAKLLEYARPGDVVYVRKVDRLGRGARHILNNVHTLQQRGVHVRSISEPIDTTTIAGRFLLTILAGQAEMDRDSIVERTTEGSRRRAREGGWLGGVVPYGYRVEGRGREARLVINEVEAAVVREVYRLYLQPGQNGLTIARELNRRGALQRNGRAEWQPAAITRMLSMTDYRGVHHYGVHGPRETITHPVPAIVDDQTWHQARALAAERKRRATRNTRRDYLLRGLLRCGRCGKTLDAYTVYRGYGTYSYYRCTSQTDPRRVFRGEAHCGLPQIPCAQADAVAWRHAETVIHDPDALERVLAASPAPQVGRQEQDELTAVRKELAELRQGRKRLLTILAEGLADEGEVRSALSTLRSNEGALQAREAALTTRLESCTETLLARDEMRGLVAAIRAELAHGVTYPRQRASLLGLARHFTVEEWERGRDLVLRPHWSFTI